MPNDHGLEIENLLQQFAFGHLPPDLQRISRTFWNLAHEMVRDLEGTNYIEQVKHGLWALLSAKDCFVRAARGLPAPEAGAYGIPQKLPGEPYDRGGYLPPGATTTRTVDGPASGSRGPMGPMGLVSSE